MTRCIFLLCLACTGCAMPGFSISGTLTLPPVLMGSNTVTGIPTMAMPTYAVEDHQQIPIVTHTITAAPRPRAVQMPPAQPQASVQPQPQLLPAPQPTGRIINASPCPEE